MDEQIPVEASSCNFFADLDLPDPEGRMLKADLGRQLRAALVDRGLTQEAAGKFLGLPESHVSDLVRGKLAGFSVERLLGYLHALGRDVEIGVAPTPGPGRGGTTVTAAAARDGTGRRRT